jgi:hypothetical protein
MGTVTEIDKNKIAGRLAPHLKKAAEAVSLFKRKPSDHSPVHSKAEPASYNEKRQVEKRVRAQIPVRYLPVHEDQQQEISREHHDRVRVSFSKNVSSGGIFLITKEELTVEGLLRLHLFLPSSSEFISVLARVMWTDREGAGLCFVGMKQKELERLKEQVGQMTE